MVSGQWSEMKPSTYVKNQAWKRHRSGNATVAPRVIAFTVRTPTNKMAMDQWVDKQEIPISTRIAGQHFSQGANLFVHAFRASHFDFVDRSQPLVLAKMAGAAAADTITGGKTLELSEYDQVRKPHQPIEDETKIKITTRTLATELSCPICLDLLTQTMTTKDCLHRFCCECITTALLRGNKECPTCRKKLVSKRGLRPDKNFDALIAKIWPDRQVLEQMQQVAQKRFQQQSNLEALQKSIEAGMKAQAANRRQRVQGSYDYEKRKRKPRGEEQEEPELENGSADSQSVNGTDAGTLSSNSDSDSEDSSDSSSDSSDSSSSSEESSNNSPAVIAANPSQEPGPSGSAPPVLTPQMPLLPPLPPSLAPQNHSALSKALSSNVPVSSITPITPMAPAAPTASCAVPVNSVTPAPGFCVDRMQKWLNDTPNSPLVPAEDNISEANSDVSEMRFDELEFELAPAKSLLKRRGIPKPLTTHRFIAASPETTLEYVSEYLSKQVKDNGFKPIKIEYFYVINQNEQMRKIFMNDTLIKAFSVARGHHLTIYFDSASPDINMCDSLFSHIVSEDRGSVGGETSSTTSTDPADEPMDTSTGLQ
uniref:RING-type E3 ubiquitin transferase n=1 Tax=Steinernema glaseri TaxID=37863 RepID=A0A1I7ZTZ9_9BILA